MQRDEKPYAQTGGDKTQAALSHWLHGTFRVVANNKTPHQDAVLCVLLRNAASDETTNGEYGFVGRNILMRYFVPALASSISPE